MAQGLQFDLKQAVLLNASFGPREIEQLVGAIAEDFSQYQVLRDAVGELQAKEEQSPASNVRLGVCLYLLGRYYNAIEALGLGDGGALAHFYLAKSHYARQEYAEAAKSFQAAEKAGYDADACALGRAESLRCGGDANAALAALDEMTEGKWYLNVTTREGRVLRQLTEFETGATRSYFRVPCALDDGRVVVTGTVGAESGMWLVDLESGAVEPGPRDVRSYLTLQPDTGRCWFLRDRGCGLRTSPMGRKSRSAAFQMI